MRKLLILIFIIFITALIIPFYLHIKTPNSLEFKISTVVGDIDYMVVLISSNREKNKQDIYFDIIIDDKDKTQVPRYHLEHTLPGLGIVKFGNVSKSSIHFRAAEWVTLDELEKIIRLSKLTIKKQEGKKVTYKLEHVDIKKTFIDPSR